MQVYQKVNQIRVDDQLKLLLTISFQNKLRIEIAMKDDYLAKVVIIGDSAVGKTNLLMRFACQDYQQSHIPTIGVDFKTKTVQVDGKSIKMHLWDTAGQQRFRTITETYYNGASGVAIVYSITDRRSFENVKEWMEQIQEHNGQNTPKVILANKCDLGTSKERVVAPEEGRLLAEKYNCGFMEVSAKNDINVTEGFMILAKSVKKVIDWEIEHPEQTKMNVVINKDKYKKNNKKECCR